MKLNINLKPPCPTLAAVDNAIEAEALSEPQRGYLGMSAIGNPCELALWLYFRFAKKPEPNARLKECCDRGHLSEDIMADKLRKAEGVELITVNPETNDQWEYVDCNGHFKGHCDGHIKGVVQAPKTNHIWEHKEKDLKFFQSLVKLRDEDEKTALKKWDKVCSSHYYDQAQCYMHYEGLNRHYLTVTAEGCTKKTSIRTDYDKAYAERVIKKARRIIEASEPPAKPYGPTFYLCRWCDYNKLCHENELPERNCRTCLHSTPIDGGKWQCEKWNNEIPDEMQRKHHSCHRYIPGLVHLEQTDVDGDNIIYKGWVDDGGLCGILENS